MTITLDCGHKIPVDGHGIGTGYATTPDGRKVCYDCADVMQRADMLTANVVTAYLSDDGQQVTTWTGGQLGNVTWHNVSKRARKTYVRVTDVHGQHWHGVGPSESGTYVTLRRSKG